ncbi:hypothetical protein [Leptolyngbya phage Lbo-JY46]
MIQEEIINLTDFKNKKVIEICEKIKKEINHLPDINSIGRLSNYISQINVLQVELELLKKIII